jgi:hypothetical protein
LGCVLCRVWREYVALVFHTIDLDETTICEIKRCLFSHCAISLKRERLVRAGCDRATWSWGARLLVFIGLRDQG